MECILVAASSAFIGFITLLFVNDCKPIGINPNLTEVTRVNTPSNKQSFFTSTSPQLFQLWCKKGEYSTAANLYFENPEESVKKLFHSPQRRQMPNY
jgi:chloride channel 7